MVRSYLSRTGDDVQFRCEWGLSRIAHHDVILYINTDARACCPILMSKGRVWPCGGGATAERNSRTTASASQGSLSARSDLSSARLRCRAHASACGMAPARYRRSCAGPAAALVDVHDHASDVLSKVVFEDDGVAALELAGRCLCRHRLRRRFVGRRLSRLYRCVVAPHRDAGNHPGPLGALLKHGGLCVIEGDDLAAVHLPVAEVHEAHGVTQVQAARAQQDRNAGWSAGLLRIRAHRGGHFRLIGGRQLP